jgi:ribosomal protein L37E
VADQLHIDGVDDDDQRCLRCGSPSLDTGWECNDCGYDNMPHYAESTGKVDSQAVGNG